MMAGISSALSGLNSSRQMVDVAANNIANSLTPGFQSTRAVQEEGPGGQGATTTLSVDASRAPLEQTGLPTDLAIAGAGAFQVQEPDGSVIATRNGSFIQDAQGNLRTDDGGYVLGSQGHIQVPSGSTFSVARNGAISAVDASGNATSLGTLTLVADSGAVGAPGSGGLGGIISGAREMSNVDPVTDIVNMIVGQRSFEANVKSIQVSDEMMKEANSLLDLPKHSGSRSRS